MITLDITESFWMNI